MRALLLAALLASGPAAATSVGTSGLDTLKIPISTRASGMGGALSAQGDDLSSLESNPARLAMVDGLIVSGGQLSYFEGISMQHLGRAWGNDPWGLGLLVSTLGTPDVQALDVNGNAAGSFSQRDLSLSAGGAWRLGRFKLGAAARMATRSLAGLTESGYGGDLGLSAALGAGFELALVAQNLGSLSALESKADPLPYSSRAGIGWKRQLYGDSSLLLEVDAILPRDSPLQLRGGAEFGYHDLFFARAGGQFSEAFDRQQNFSAGIGLRYHGIQIDYAYVPFGSLGSAQRASLTLFITQLLNGGKTRAELRPSKVRGLRVVEKEQSMEASWQEPEAGKVSGYRVYVRKGGDAELKPATAKVLSKPLIVFKGLQGGREYGLAVAAVDAKGEEGELTSELKFKVEEKARVTLGPPEAPQGLKALKKGRDIYLRWQAAPGKGLRYQVYLADRPHGAYAPIHDGSTRETEQQFDVSDFKGRSAYMVIKTLRSDENTTVESDFSAEAALNLR